MKIIKTKTYVIDGSADITIDLTNDGSGDTVSTEVILQVEDDVTIALKGRAIDDDDFEYRDVACMSLATLKVEAIEAAGIFIVPVEALSSLFLSVTGSTTLVVKILS